VTTDDMLKQLNEARRTLRDIRNDLLRKGWQTDERREAEVLEQIEDEVGDLADSLRKMADSAGRAASTIRATLPDDEDEEKEPVVEAEA
jgi:HAMP domain-containing protein